MCTTLPHLGSEGRDLSLEGEWKGRREVFFFPVDKGDSTVCLNPGRNDLAKGKRLSP